MISSQNDVGKYRTKGHEQVLNNYLVKIVFVPREDEPSNRNVKRTSKEWYTRLG